MALGRLRDATVTVGAWVRLRAVGWVLHLHTGAENAHARREVGQANRRANFYRRFGITPLKCYTRGQGKHERLRMFLAGRRRRSRDVQQAAAVTQL